ncbi:hypothetical protein HNY73_000221 [Argiope bruennichi]|uniref:Uncharacterized protein n=1 Tax=Argiope bruennichi TaxID=94029 RepID=A0A8T0G1Q4_ARGBR|nr:hypothetical protein HNY73_000221 [Argiope bruennichi]
MFRKPSSPTIWQPTFSLLDQKTHRFVATNIVYLIPQGVRETTDLQSRCQNPRLFRIFRHLLLHPEGSGILKNTQHFILR